MRVYVVSEYEPYEGGSVEGVFDNEETAIKFAKQTLTSEKGKEFEVETDEPNPNNKINLVDRRTTWVKKIPDGFLFCTVEEWDVK